MQKNGMRGVFSVGRVQTPTLFLIYQRNEEIKHALALKLLLLELNSYDFNLQKVYSTVAYTRKYNKRRIVFVHFNNLFN